MKEKAGNRKYYSKVPFDDRYGQTEFYDSSKHHYLTYMQKQLTPVQSINLYTADQGCPFCLAENCIRHYTNTV